jgi:hypothetical protein
VILPDDSTFQLEQTLLTPDTSKALVQVVVIPTGSCKSAEGASIIVDSPPGVTIRYMDSTGYPRTALTQIAALASPWRGAAAIYNVDPTATLAIRVTHPSCKQLPFPAALKSTTFTGKVAMKPLSENISSAYVIVLGDGDATDAGADDASSASDATAD